MSAVHTPAPWTVAPDPEWPADYYSVYYDIAGSGAEIAGRIGEPANAALIAAAPELLATLEAAITPLIHLGDFIGNEFAGKLGIEAYDRCAIIGRARDAIAKARGTT